MSEENAIAVQPALAGDQLLAVAEAAEKRIDAVQRIKGLALRVTNHQDWTDQGGKPYLQVSGSEKVARLFGISWRLDEPTREDHEDGHFTYTFKGYFQMGTAEIEVIGTRSSSDPFFSRKTEWINNEKVVKTLPPSEIDRNDVKKGAMTNCIGNGITRLLGIRNLTWEEVKSGGVQQDRVGKVEYKTNKPAEKPASSPSQPSDGGAVTVEGRIGDYTPQVGNKPGQFVLSTMESDITIGYWKSELVQGITDGHDLARCTYVVKTSKAGRQYNDLIKPIEWIDGEAEEAPTT